MYQAVGLIFLELDTAPDPLDIIKFTFTKNPQKRRPMPTVGNVRGIQTLGGPVPSDLWPVSDTLCVLCALLHMRVSPTA